KEVHTIDVIGKFPDVTPSQVSKELMVTLGTVTTSLNNLERKGLVYRVSEADKLEKTREQLLKKLRRGSSNSYAAIKKLVWESQFKDWQDYATLELNLQESLAQTEDFKEGVRAHSERRRPKFTGK
ncbi:enoyl-CoA hydratase-related protein, partial [Streptococcus mitis]|uniref:enoyl-CoA hydratase-related protein n=1 Tax=Streptococcus mitis TaxID=28037 RepID=UPI001D16FE32